LITIAENRTKRKEGTDPRQNATGKLCGKGVEALFILRREGKRKNDVGYGSKDKPWDIGKKRKKKLGQKFLYREGGKDEREI